MHLTPGKVVFLVNIVLLAALWAGDWWNDRHPAPCADESLGYSIFAVFVLVFLFLLDLAYGLWRLVVYIIS